MFWYTTSQHLLKLPLYKYIMKGDYAFSQFAHSVWNSLPFHIRNAVTTDIFKSNLNTHLFNLQEFDELSLQEFDELRPVQCV